MPRGITRKLIFPPTFPNGFRWALRRLERWREEKGGIEKARKEARKRSEQLACARWYTESFVGYTWMAQMVGQQSVAILRRPRFFLFSFSVPHRVDSSSSINLLVISHGESNGRGSLLDTTHIDVMYIRVESRKCTRMTEQTDVQVKSEVKVIGEMGISRWRQCQERWSFLTSVAST